MPTLLAALALLGLALLLGATVYESVVMAPNYERDIPGSIRAAREFLQRVTPAHFFRPLSPVVQLLLLATLISAWGVREARGPVAVALGATILLDVITFTFHYPRLALMFRAPIPEDPAALRRAARGWSRGNLLRVLILLVAFGCGLQAVVLLGR